MRQWTAALAMMGLVLGACSGGGAATVAMESGRVFTPKTLTVATGERVTFISASADAHSVTADGDSLPEGADYFASGGFESEAAARADVAGGLLVPGQSFSVRFDVPGTYRYFCIPHESSGMTGRIEVVE